MTKSRCKFRSQLTQNALKSAIHYDPISGKFTWLKGKRRGKEAGSVLKTKYNSYRNILIDGYFHPAGQLAWLYMTGTYSKLEIDHRDRNGLNNAWSNLREATRSQNGANCGLQSNNTSGYKGVSKSSGRWAAIIQVNGKRKHLGTFETPEEAFEAYKAKAIEVFGEFANFE